MWTPLLAITSILALAACAAAVPRSLPNTQDASPSVPEASWAAIFLDGYEEVARAAGLAPLHDATIPESAREVRVWIGGGLAYPQELYRVTEDDDAYAGELIRFWPRGRMSAAVRYHQQGSCGLVRRGPRVETCRVLFERTPDWEEILHRAENAGLWSLPDESTLSERRFVFDGWGMTVELRAGDRYRAYHYHNPDVQPGPESRRALRIARAFRSAAELARPSTVERVYRGVYTEGPGLLEFRPCGDTEVWGVQGELPGSERGSAGGIDSPARRLYLEVRGSLSPSWLHDDRLGEFARVLRITEVLVAREWSPAACDAP